jgi:hypothetical protein
MIALFYPRSLGAPPGSAPRCRPTVPGFARLEWHQHSRWKPPRRGSRQPSTTAAVTAPEPNPGLLIESKSCIRTTTRPPVPANSSVEVQFLPVRWRLECIFRVLAHGGRSQ